MNNVNEVAFYKIEKGEKRPYGVWFESDVFGFGAPQKIWLINPEDWPDSRYEKKPIFIFGFADASFVAVFGKKHIEEAMDDVASWILEMIPGIAVEPDYPTDFADFDDSAYFQAQQEAEYDLTDFSLGNGPPVWIPSWEWIVQKIDPGSSCWEQAISAAESSAPNDDWGLCRVVNDLEEILQRRADERLVTMLSSLDEETTVELEAHGYDAESAYAIASNNNDSVIAVNGDLIISGQEFNLSPAEANGAMLWNEKDCNGITPIQMLMNKLHDSNYESVDRCGHWPTGEEAELSVDGIFEEMIRLGHGQAAISRSLQIIFRLENFKDHVYWNSSSGDVDIYALHSKIMKE